MFGVRVSIAVSICPFSSTPSLHCRRIEDMQRIRFGAQLVRNHCVYCLSKLTTCANWAAFSVDSVAALVKIHEFRSLRNDVEIMHTGHCTPGATHPFRRCLQRLARLTTLRHFTLRGTKTHSLSRRLTVIVAMPKGRWTVGNCHCRNVSMGFSSWVPRFHETWRGPTQSDNVIPHLHMSTVPFANITCPSHVQVL